MLNFSRQNLRQSHEGPWLLLDLVMLGLLMINLLWIIFDSLYATRFFKDSLSYLSADLVQAYAPVHENFTLYDLAFVAVFFAEFCFRWAVSVYRSEHMRWYFFPFLHWYDLIGCIPVSGARIFRFLRIFSILYRLHKYQIIDLRDTALFRFLTFYYNVFVEELSDRIVAKVLTDAQKDIEAGSPLIEEITTKVLATRQDVLCQWFAAMTTHLGESIAHPENGETIRQHVRSSVGKAVRGNAQVSLVKLVPLLGSGIERQLEDAVTDIVTHSVIHLLKDLNAQQINEFIDHGINKFDAREQALDREFLQVVSECLELIKQHVTQQRWKIELQQSKAAKASTAPAATESAGSEGR